MKYMIPWIMWMTSCFLCNFYLLFFIISILILKIPVLCRMIYVPAILRSDMNLKIIIWVPCFTVIFSSVRFLYEFVIFILP